MANISFESLDKDLNIGDTTLTAYASTDATSTSTYSYISTGGDDFEIQGSGFTDDGTFPTGGTVTRVRLDLDNELLATAEFDAQGLSFDITDLDVGTGTVQEQSNRLWEVVLSGADTFDLNFTDPSVTLRWAGDGADVFDGELHIGNNDIFTGGDAGLTGFTVISGDYDTVGDGTAVGGNDFFEYNGGRAAIGDFVGIAAGASGIGGDDRFAPELLPNMGQTYFIVGDSSTVSGNLTGGDDFIDMRSTDVSASSDQIFLVGDTDSITSSGAVVGGDDTIHGSSKADQIYGDTDDTSVGFIKGGDDWLAGYNGDDLIWGNGGDDYMSGAAGADTLEGQGDDDTLQGGAGGDMLNGGAGEDTADYSDATGGVTVRLFNGTGANNVAAGDTLSNIENVIGSDFSDVLVGADGEANILSGGLGDDFLSGRSGSDTMLGGAGADTLDGGSGGDTASYEDGTGGVLVRLFNGTGHNGFAQGDLYTSIENAVGTSFSDVLVGTDQAGKLFGGGGNDFLSARAGKDTLQGGEGADTLIGGGGIDTADYSDASGGVLVRLWNGTGQGNESQGDELSEIENIVGSMWDDVLIGWDGGIGNELRGGQGDDFLSGRTGSDTFVFDRGGDADTIGDFIAGLGTDDMIRLIGFGTDFDTFVEVVSAASDDGSDTTIDFGGGDVIVLEGVVVADLHSDDFIFG